MVQLQKIIKGFRHAFATGGVKPTESEIDLIRKLAGFVVRRDMAVPAVMFLESVRPLNFVGSQSMIFFKPLISRFFTRDEYDRLATILEKREVIDMLINEIERHND